VYRHAGDILASNLDLTGVESDPYLDAESANGVPDSARPPLPVGEPVEVQSHSPAMA
jgi:hypothetical protein